MWTTEILFKIQNNKKKDDAENAVVVFIMKINQELFSVEMLYVRRKIFQGLLLKCNLSSTLYIIKTA
jgi:hypothetical protein